MSSDWQALGDVQYRKFSIYDLNWDGESCALDQHHVAAARFGGPIAFVRDESKFVKVVSGDLGPRLRIFTSAGRKLADVAWDDRASASSGRLIGMGWTDRELLVTVREQGSVAVFDALGHRTCELSLIDDAARKSLSPVWVVACQVWSDGLVALLSDQTLAAVDAIHTAAPRRFSMRSGLNSGGRGSGGGSDRVITSLAVLEPQFTASGLVEAVLATSDGDVIVADEQAAEGGLLAEPMPAPIVAMAVAPSGRLLACFAKGGMLSVVASDFTSRFLDFDTSAADPPGQMVWCGGDCVLLHWSGQGVLAVGSDGEWHSFSYPASTSALVLAPEPDCCRIISQGACELLQRVPAATEAVNRIGSTDPAAILFDSMEAFEDGDPKADENIRAMVRSAEAAAAGASNESGGGGGCSGSGGQLAEAVRACISAATAEFDMARQCSLLKAAAYGKGFLTDYDADEFVDACKKLRVLNDVRRPAVGLPLTAEQYDCLTPEALVDRLVSRGHHFLALRICEYLRLPGDRVVVRWACEKLAASSPSSGSSNANAALSDEALRDLICAKMQAQQQQQQGGGGGGGGGRRAGACSYAEVIRAANAAGRRGLAIMLTEREPQVADQVSLLLNMGEQRLALQKATAASDPDLIYQALLHIEQEVFNAASALPGGPGGSAALGRERERFYKLVDAYPEALALLKAYYRHKSGYTEQRQLHNLCVWRGKFAEAAALAVQTAYQQERLPERLERLREAEKLFGQSRELTFQQQATHEQGDLLGVQHALEQRTGLPVFVDMPLADTLYHVISVAATQDAPATAAPLMAEAAKLQKRFRVPDKRFWHIKLRALAAAGQWEQLRRFAAEKKSPVGYAPFVRACIAHQQPPEEIEHYVEKVQTVEERYDLFLEARLLEKAAEAAVKLRDPRRTHEVRELAALGNAQLLARVDDILLKT